MEKIRKISIYNNAFVIRLHNRRIIISEHDDFYLINTIRTIGKNENIPHNGNASVLNFSTNPKLLETNVSYSKEAFESMVYGFSKWKEWKAQATEK